MLPRKRYKLTKPYPGVSLFLSEGDEIEFEAGKNYTKIGKKDGLHFAVIRSEVDDAPDHWEEVLPYRITQIKFENAIGTYDEDGVCIQRSDGCNPENTVSLENALELIKNGWMEWTIYQVERVEDGEVFTVGDVVTYDYAGKNEEWVISHFKHHRNGLAAWSAEDNFCVIDMNGFRHVELTFTNDEIKKAFKSLKQSPQWASTTLEEWIGQVENQLLIYLNHAG